jgi:hypothetical protein
MSQRSSGSAGPGGDDWPDELWPGDDDPPGGGGTVGDQVSAQIVPNGGAASATAIQDPAQPPVGGTAP